MKSKGFENSYTRMSWPLDFLVKRFDGLRIEGRVKQPSRTYGREEKNPAISWNGSLVFKILLINVPTDLFWLLIIYE